MPQTREYSEKKTNYFAKLDDLLKTYSKLIFVDVDNVQSNQMHRVRKGLRGKGEMLMGKNTLMRKVITARAARADATEIDKVLLQKVVAEKRLVNNLGIIFTNAEYKEITDVIKQHRIQAPARVGAIAPLDVIVPAGNTGLEPGATNFFQALQIPTKIVKGCVEISAEKKVLSTGEKVDQSVSTLLQKLNIKPFFYGLNIKFIFDNGSLFGPEILELTDSFFESNIREAIKNVAAVSLEIGYATQASAPHAIVNAFKELLAISLTTEYIFDDFNGKQLRKDILEGKVAAAPAPAAAAPAAAAPAGKAAPKEEPKKEEEDDDMGLGLFD